MMEGRLFMLRHAAVLLPVACFPHFFIVEEHSFTNIGIISQRNEFEPSTSFVSDPRMVIRRFIQHQCPILLST
ncbi:hypothetical protein V8C40DRAFT_239737 [Trichoderma camerunense]